jgi:hypothetical protein
LVAEKLQGKEKERNENSVTCFSVIWFWIMKESSQISLFIGLSYNGWLSLLGFKVIDFEILKFSHSYACFC